MIALVQKTTGFSRRPQSMTDMLSSTILRLPDSTYFTMNVLPALIFNKDIKLAYLDSVGDFSTITTS